MGEVAKPREVPTVGPAGPTELSRMAYFAPPFLRRRSLKAAMPAIIISCLLASAEIVVRIPTTELALPRRASPTARSRGDT